jgi:cob(I)alamin adenosyltransferase
MTASLVDPIHPHRAAASGRSEPLALVPPLGPPLRLVSQPEGLLQVHTAPFRGSFATVFSQAVRSAGLGSRVLVSQFLRGGVDQGLAGRQRLCGRLEWLRPATPHCLEGPPGSQEPADLAAVVQVWEYSRQRLLAGDLDLLVLDELGLAIALGYLSAEAVIAALEQRPAHLDVILTGPSMPAGLMAMADQVTQLRRGG